MLSQIAQVFSSQGVVLPGTELVPVRVRSAPEDQAATPFKQAFDQASAKLEISQKARDLQANASKGPKGPNDLTDEEKARVKELKQRDQEVRRHEQQHLASAGGFAKGGASYEYAKGPDGNTYAVGGHVSIDAGPVSGNPEATLAKAQAVQRAALAPADPSGQDRAVASAAAQMAIEARKEISEKRGEENGGGAEGGSPAAGNAAAPEPDEAAPSEAVREAGETAEAGETGAALRGYAAQSRGASNPAGLRFSAYA